MISINKNIFDMIEYPKQGILSKEVVKQESLDVTLFCMAKGNNISEHTSTKKAIVYILEGKGSFNLSGKEIKMEKGILIFMKENEVHSLFAEENLSFLLILA